MNSYDYIVIGAGSAGCVVTNRLVTAGKSVLLLEAGPADNHPWVHIPATVFKLQGTARMWKFESEPEPNALGRKVQMTQGRTLGGGSSVNGMVYIRGQAQDYDTWRELGCPGWGYDDVLPVFKRSESNMKFADEYHGTEGPLKVGDARYRHPLSYAFLRAAQETGLRYTEDFNGERQDGVGFYQTTIAEGRRQSTQVTFLSRVRNNPLLTLHTDAQVESIVFENGAAIGVRYRMKDNSVQEGRVREEVVLCAGAFGSPKALQLSGVGPAALLAELGIPLTRDSPGVGENFQDHWGASVLGQTREPIALLGHDKGLRGLRHGLEYLLFRSGLLSFNIIESGGFMDTSNSGRPDIQIHMIPNLTGDADRPPPPGHGLTISPCILRPKARGRVHIKSRDAADSIVINANTLGHPDDVTALIRGVKLARKILHAPSLARIIERELAPGDGPGDLSADTLEHHVRRVAKTVYHPCGTCRMGSDDQAVVDPKLQVHGVPRLRVADASIMPTLISGNTTAPSIMIGERCAEFLLAANR